jgi:phage shock protein PspC (stress-responsive transcriptional regulator)
MNKVLQVNIGGEVFQVEEPAYKKLDRYLTHIKKKQKGQDAAEILSDMEQRVAELLKENSSDKAFIDSAIVETVINTMGRPEDFDTYNTAAGGGTNNGSKFPGFYRDTNNKFIGGVCAGLSNRFDIDPLWVRLAFLVSLFIGGTGFLIYVILWALVPGLPKYK